MAESPAAAALTNGRAESPVPERRRENAVETWWARRKKAKKAK